ncbi:SAF domain-containing protein [Nocardia blacklockiae]|uniref:SAF domain-containing protein n=1 Tax=Nocardia blacklockiae TaxID=480036 RepID=UPI001893D266|nr:SAF domain-containing protein [Nocardia blacklockiae]MBF6172648.1 flagellar biosynthesis protein FlgA [Nocardia blacklockiae]
MRRPHRTADLGRTPRWDRITRFRPAWADSTLVRRVVAAVLVVLAGVLYLRGDPDTRQVDIVVAAHDLTPGRVLDPGDLRRVPRPAGTVPEGAVRDAGAVLGATVAGAVRGGEILTDLRVIGPRLAAATAGPDARIVPIRLADNAVAEILRLGDRVDVIAGAEPESGGDHGPAPPRTLATEAVVVLVAGAGKTRGSDERIVLVALDPAHATAVAAASLATALTVVFH